MIKVIKIGPTRATVTITGEGVVCDDAHILKQLQVLVDKYSPGFGDPEVYLSREIVSRLGGVITHNHPPSEELVSDGGLHDAY